MTLNKKIAQEIYELVKIRPRTIQEISQAIDKNWRTAERYIEKLQEDEGCISTQIFRGGTRGALKVVYWVFTEDIHSVGFQKELVEKILGSSRKWDFSPFDIYQYIPENEKNFFIEREGDVSEGKRSLIGFLKQAKKQILIFSGNLSWVSFESKGVKVIDILRDLAKGGVSIKVLTRVSLIGEDNVRKILAINNECGKNLVEVRHRYHPLRGFIIDGKIVRLRERRDPSFYKPEELKKSIQIFYDIYDLDWVEWLQKLFWRMFTSAMSADRRIKEIDEIQEQINI